MTKDQSQKDMRCKMLRKAESEAYALSNICHRLQKNLDDYSTRIDLMKSVAFMCLYFEQMTDFGFFSHESLESEMIYQEEKNDD